MAKTTTGSVAELGRAVERVFTRGIPTVARHSKNYVTGGTEASASVVASVFGLAKSVLNNTLSLIASTIEAGTGVASSRVFAPFTALALAAGAFFGASHLMKRHTANELAAQEAQNAFLEQQLAARQNIQQTLTETPYHPAEAAGDKWSTLAEQRAATTATDRLAQQPVSSNTLGA